MSIINFRNWYIVSLFGFLMVALLGTTMRYKIDFELPMLHQKSLQYAHSHFAFSGWVTQTLMLLLIRFLKTQKVNLNYNAYRFILYANIISSVALLFSFVFTGYSLLSVLISTITLIVFFVFCFRFWIDSKTISENNTSLSWFKHGLVFYILSTLGSAYIANMMITKSFHQDWYLSSMYWYLHFQYNGWFFFAIVGVFLSLFSFSAIQKKQMKLIRNLFVYSCYAGYALSVLWLKLPSFIFILSIVASIVQVIAWVLFVKLILSNKSVVIQGQPKSIQFIFLLLAFFITIKIALQAASNIPYLSHLAFGYRSVVIAYLHLILLSIVSVFLLLAPFLIKLFDNFDKIYKPTIFTIVAIYINQMLLGLQALGAISFTLFPTIPLAFPQITLALLFIAVVILFLTINLIVQYFRST
ncbi:MAG: hypothetical protein IT246_05380 [Bacteroidia bacterium]|nr:hypothetical protein [Bacteroidia bacterium]MCZ2140644.1 hypothetical protein [Bacteroidia bacterium]